ncbi:TPA: hypothetical protein ACJKDM_001966 [Neisseria meningitidis]
MSGKTVSLDFTFWIPAFAGMTAEWFLLLPINAAISSLVIPSKTENQNQKPKIRHSRAGGNLGLSARKLIGKNGFFRFYVLDSRLRGNDDEKIVVVSDKILQP